MPNAETLFSWGRQASWATFVGAFLFVSAGAVTYLVGGLAGGIVMVACSILLAAGIIGFLAYGYSAGFASLHRDRHIGLEADGGRR